MPTLLDPVLRYSWQSRSSRKGLLGLILGEFHCHRFFFGTMIFTVEYDIMILSQWNKVSIWCRISPLSPPKIGIPKAMAEAQCPFFAVGNQVDQGSALTPQGAHAADLQHVLGDFDGFAYGHQRWGCWNGFGLLSRVHPILIDFVKRFQF